MPKSTLACLSSVGPATLKDFALLEIHTLDDLARADPDELYQRLCRLSGCTIDICQYDVFCCAVAQARNPHLPQEQKKWFWWSAQRKKALEVARSSPEMI